MRLCWWQHARGAGVGEDRAVSAESLGSWGFRDVGLRILGTIDGTSGESGAQNQEPDRAGYYDARLISRG